MNLAGPEPGQTRPSTFMHQIPSNTGIERVTGKRTRKVESTLAAQVSRALRRAAKDARRTVYSDHMGNGLYRRLAIIVTDVGTYAIATYLHSVSVRLRPS